MQIILDFDERVTDGEVPEILRKLADSFPTDRSYGEEGGTINSDDGNLAADWVYYEEKVVDI